MQPYFLPYIGYFQLINAVDVFVLYDNIKYTKKGWINRNRILLNGDADYISLPLKKDSDYLNIDRRFLSDDWDIEKAAILNRIKEAYRKAPYFNLTFEVITAILRNEDTNLFGFLYSSIKQICQYLNISTNIVLSSSISINHSLKSADKIIAICKHLNATKYINATGGQKLYSKGMFLEHGLILDFIQSNPIIYSQFKNQFIPCFQLLML